MDIGVDLGEEYRMAERLSEADSQAVLARTEAETKVTITCRFHSKPIHGSERDMKECRALKDDAYEKGALK